MDNLLMLGQLVSAGVLAYGAWICASCAGRYDGESLVRDVLESRAAHTRAEGPTSVPIGILSSDDETGTRGTFLAIGREFGTQHVVSESTTVDSSDAAVCLKGPVRKAA